MLKGWFVRLALLAAFSCFAQAATVSLGYMTLQPSGDQRYVNFFVFNYTNGIDQNVMTNVTFDDVSLTVDWAGSAPSSFSVPQTMVAQPNGHMSDMFLDTFAIEKAVFKATLNSFSTWTLGANAGGGTFTPASSAIEMVLMPSSGLQFIAAHESWDIIVESAGVDNPEPATLLITGLALLGLAMVRRRRTV